ncbi:MAG: glycosyltransferase family 4 protein [Chitinivibrionia bacterium]|nr:glycosyltransferase family 4 protein [Chitinivibrionia bacterium]
MKICILTPRFPFPENGGDVLRINNICRYLKSKGHQLILVSYYDNKDIKNNLSEQLYDKIYYIKHRKIRAYINTILAFIFNKPLQIGYYFSFEFLSVFKKVIKIEQPDLYISHLQRMVSYLNICRLHENSIVEATDLISKMYASTSNSSGISLKKFIYKIENERIKKHELQTLNAYKKCVFVSKEDIKHLDYKSVSVHACGVQCLPKIPAGYNKNKIVFVGNMRTLQNSDAVKFFIDEIFPVIKKAIPNAVFHIIGAEPPGFIQNMADGKNIIVSGFVQSIENEIKDAAVSVAPLRIAAGIQNKVLISMACGIPTVLTSCISAGIPELVSNQNCVITDEKTDFANAVISLMQNENMRNDIGAAGYEMVQSKYSWNEKLEGYEEL